MAQIILQLANTILAIIISTHARAWKLVWVFFISAFALMTLRRVTARLIVTGQANDTGLFKLLDHQVLPMIITILITCGLISLMVRMFTNGK